MMMNWEEFAKLKYNVTCVTEISRKINFVTFSWNVIILIHHSANQCHYVTIISRQEKYENLS